MDAFFLCVIIAFNGCPYEVDKVWDITWPNTERNLTDTQLCPGGHEALGKLDWLHAYKPPSLMCM